jgi:F420-0:gamma-glutamyl ligase-like protein
VPKNVNRGVHETHFRNAPSALAKVLKAARKAGCTITATGKGHYQIRNAAGVVHAPGTPRDGDEAAKQLRYELRQRLGVDV